VKAVDSRRETTCSFWDSALNAIGQGCFAVYSPQKVTVACSTQARKIARI
jgi:hypothetical protein